MPPEHRLYHLTFELQRFAFHQWLQFPADATDDVRRSFQARTGSQACSNHRKESITVLMSVSHNQMIVGRTREDTGLHQGRAKPASNSIPDLFDCIVRL